MARRSSSLTDRLVVVEGWVARDLEIPEVVGDVDDLQGVEEVERRGLVAEVQGDDVRAAAHLPLGQLVLGMGGVVGIEQALQLAVPGHAVGQGRGGVALAADPQVERLHPLQQHPGVEGRQGRAGVAQEVAVALVDQLEVAQDAPRPAPGPGRRYAWWPNRPRCRRPAAGASGRSGWRRRCRPPALAPASLAIAATAAMSITSSSGLAGVSRNIDRGVGAHGGAPGGEVRPVDHGGLDAEAGQVLGDDPAARAEQGPAGHQVVAGLEQADQGRGHRRHAGRGRTAGLGAFQQRQRCPRTSWWSGWRSANRRSPDRRRRSARRPARPSRRRSSGSGRAPRRSRRRANGSEPPRISLVATSQSSGSSWGVRGVLRSVSGGGLAGARRA